MIALTPYILEQSLLDRGRSLVRAIARRTTTAALRVLVPLWPMRRGVPWVAALALLAVFGAPAHSDDGASETPLATKERIIHDRVLQLEDQMYRLIEQLRESEPEKARRMEKVLARMGELGVRRQLETVIEVLNEDRLDEALSEQDRLLENLSTLLTLLIEDADDSEERKKEIERLQRLAEQLDKLISEENRLRDESRAAQQALEGGERNAEAAAAIEQLLSKQQALLADTRTAAQKARANKVDDSTTGQDLLDRQKALAQQAEALARLLQEKNEPASAKAAASAMRNMTDAVDERNDDALAVAVDAQEDAVEDLKRALEKLTKRPKQDAEEPNLEELADEQAKTSEQTAQVAEQMRDNEASSEPTPGQDNVEMSRQHMDAATEQLNQENAAAAGQQQQQAVDQLEQAKKQIQQKIDQLKRELQQQRLADLEKRFKDMLTKQQAINRRTIELDAIPRDEWKRREQLRAVEQSQQERGLGELADTCLGILREDGTTTVLPQLVEYLRDDMLVVAERLADSKVGPRTQAAEKDIVATIEDILEAIEQNRSQTDSAQDQNQRDQQGQPGEPGLLPTSAELNLLARLQTRVFRRTQAFQRAGESDPDQLGRLAEKQTDVAKMATEMNSKLTRPPAAAGQPANKGTHD